MENDVLGRCGGKISGSTGTSEKVVLFFRTERSKRKFVFHFNTPRSNMTPRLWGQNCKFFTTPFFDTSFRPSRPFFGKWYWFVQMVNAIPGRNLPVLNFAYHLPKPCTDRFSHVQLWMVTNRFLRFSNKNEYVFTGPKSIAIILKFSLPSSF